MVNENAAALITVLPYTYVSAWRVIGGVSLPADINHRVLHQSERIKFTITTEPNEYLAKIDRGTSIANSALNLLLGIGKPYSADAIKTIQEGRQTVSGRDVVFVMEAHGECKVDTSSCREGEGFIFGFDMFDKAPIKDNHAHDLDSMKLAIGFESEAPSRFELVAEGIYLTDPKDRVLYSLNFTMNADLTFASPLTDKRIETISERFSKVHTDENLASVGRLYSQMAILRGDAFKLFLSAWTAFEIFLAKAFKEYESDFLSPAVDGQQAKLRERYIARVREVMRDKYRLTDKFNCVTAVIFADADESSVERDTVLFKKLKALRDKVMHGEAFVERELPIGDLSALLRKYVNAYLAVKIVLANEPRSPGRNDQGNNRPMIQTENIIRR